MSFEIQIPFDAFMQPGVSEALSDLMLSLHSYLNAESQVQAPKATVKAISSKSAPQQECNHPIPAAAESKITVTHIATAPTADAHPKVNESPTPAAAHVSSDVASPKVDEAKAQAPAVVAQNRVADPHEIDPSIFGIASEGSEQWKKFYRDLKNQAQQLLDLLKSRQTLLFDEAVALLCLKSTRALPPILAKLRRNADTYTVTLPYEECFIDDQRALRWIESSAQN